MFTRDIIKSVSIIIFILFCFLVFSPLIAVFKESFIKEGKISFSIYQEILTDLRLRQIFFRTLRIGFFTALTTLFLGFPFAWFLERIKIPFKNFFSLFSLFPLLLPPYILGFTFLFELQLRGLVRNLGINLNLYNLGGIVFILSLCYFPFVILFLSAGLKSFNRGIEEAGNLIASPLKSFLKITFPLLLPYILLSFSFVFILTFSEYVVSELLRVHNYTFELYYQFSAFHNFAKATALSFPLLLFTLPLILWVEKIMQERPYIGLGGNFKPYFSPRKNFFKIPGFIFATGLVSVAVIFPLFVLIKGTGSFKNLFFVLSANIQEMVLSIFLALLGAFFCSLVSLFLGYLLENTRGIYRRCINILTLIPLAIPGPIVGLGLVRWLNRPQTALAYSTFLPLLLAYLIRFSCFGIRIISTALKTYGKELWESALIFPVSGLKRFFKINFPLLHPFITITFIISLLFCLTELSATLFLIPPGEMTFLIKIESFFHHGDMESIFAMCLWQVLITLIPISLLLPFTHRKFSYAA
ncbi:MAG: iron ABC transporter permease [Candidatus Omnitrophica bacterium]|nr:iron ABC transporter permease [Candidatus Omnitrophota bacterium]MCM8798348.1 iron ABC transporter permease [Candidatus Omnitrophota bacterium]